MWTIYKKQRTNLKKFNGADDFRHILRKELDEASFQHDMAYGNFQDLPRRTDSDKVFRNKALKLQAIYNMNDNKEALLHCSKIVMTNISGNGVTSKLMIYLFQINNSLVVITKPNN